MKPSRRQFVSAALVGLPPKTSRPVTGRFVDDAAELGHRLRSRGPFRKPARRIRIPLVIVGGGIAGLSAAWRLGKRGFRDFVLLEMESQAGGVSRWGENEVSAFPWAAHYLPAPGPKSTLARELLEDLGVLSAGKFDELHLCHSPQERLYLHGRWQEGLEPETGVSSRHRDQYRRFEERMARFRASGQFTIPMENGARPSPLDRISAADWLREEGFDSPYLAWYMDYACRDDYGSPATETSAWAGIHYFAAREPEEKGPLTWPEGNGWFVRRLLERVGAHVRTNSPVYRISRRGSRLEVHTEGEVYDARVVIFAAPTFLAPYLVEDAPGVSQFEYSPWLTANLTLDTLPRERGTEPAWDNVIYDSPALGYVVATHQSLASRTERSVWTFYWALTEDTPSRSRSLLLATDWTFWKEAILRDLEKAHPDIRTCVSRIDIMRLGHAMVRPRVGFLFSEERQRAARFSGNLLYANSDLSGFSIFEEAQYRGVRAAEHALGMLG